MTKITIEITDKKASEWSEALRAHYGKGTASLDVLATAALHEFIAQTHQQWAELAERMMNEEETK